MIPPLGIPSWDMLPPQCLGVPWEQGPRLEALASDTGGVSWEASGDTYVQPLWLGAAAKPCWNRQGQVLEMAMPASLPLLVLDPSLGLDWAGGTLPAALVPTPGTPRRYQPPLLDPLPFLPV